MGFRLETAGGHSLAIRPTQRLGAPITIDLEELVATQPQARERWLADHSDRSPGERVKTALRQAQTIADLHAALEPIADHDATPDLAPPGSLILQPSEERRRSGSHYTPRTLTEPIVRTTLQPLLDAMCGPTGEPPHPDRLLELKLCDPAMGSGAFLVEASRQLADAVIQAWTFHGLTPVVPPDEDLLVYASRLVAQRCLYGVDRNPVAVDLAKMSLWLATLSRNHPLTFVDHALKHGDSLVGLTRFQIEGFHWDEKQARQRQGFIALNIRDHLERASELRGLIRAADDDTPEPELAALLSESEGEAG